MYKAFENFAAPALQTSHPRWEVDRRESLDLRPAVDAIMQAENWILDRIAPGEKLFIVMGEFHANMVDLFLKHAVLSMHVQQAEERSDRAFAVGCEMPHNFRVRHGGRQDADDPHGIHSMNAFIENPKGAWNIPAQQAVFRYCMERNISVSFNDVAFKGTYLDISDAYTNDLIERHPDIRRGAAKDSIDRVNNAAGMAYSNLAQAELAINHAQRTDSKIYILQCGNLHVAGSDHYGYPYDQSVSALLLKSGHAVLPVINDYGYCRYDIAKDGRALIDRTGVKIRDMMRIAEPGCAGSHFEHLPYDEARREINRYSNYDL